MRKYVRSHWGSVFFFTVVTFNRRPILTTEIGRKILKASIESVRQKHPFEILAICLLPDHLHTVWELPRNDTDYSRRWRLIKSKFSREWIKSGEYEPHTNESRRKKKERAIWQRRFYEHTCRNQDDLKRCIDYVHINPLKHGLVERVSDWKWSTFHRYVDDGEYEVDWGSSKNWYGDEFKHAE